jgi:pimeloyl-ACP methyl ester carboxylesterase
VEEALRCYVDSGHGTGAWEHAPALFKAAARVNAHTLYGMAIDRTEPLSRDLAMKIQAPTLLVEGSKSPPAFAAIQDVLEEVIPNVTRVRIEAGDHFLPLKLAEHFNELVVQFIQKCEPPAAS